jgi:hypothetical protein
MTCMTAFAETMAMATTQFTRSVPYCAIPCQDAASWVLESNGGRSPRMNWVVVTGKEGGRELRIQWTSAMGN